MDIRLRAFFFAELRAKVQFDLAKQWMGFYRWSAKKKGLRPIPVIGNP
jgi:hypothetical protein